MGHLNESIVEDAALEWFRELIPQLAPGEPAAERDSFGEVDLAGCLREAIPRPAGARPATPEDARATDKESLSVPESSERRLKP